MPTDLEEFTTEKKKWCVMVYFAADIDLEAAALADLEQMKAAGSSSHVDLLAQLNPGGSRVVRRYHLQKDTYLEEDRVSEINDNGVEVILHNNDAKQDLFDFIKWATDRSTAEHYALVLWGHAQGWKADALNPCSIPAGGAAPNPITPSIAAYGQELSIAAQSIPITLRNGETGFLSNADLRDVLAATSARLGRKIDILGLDACLMAMAEICCQVDESVDYLVACEDTVPDESWPYDSILKLLVEHAEQMKPEDLARIIVWKFVFDFGRKKKYVTQSICRVGSDGTGKTALDRFTTAVEGLAATLTNEMKDFEVRWAVMIARTYVQTFYIRDYVDIYDFCRLLSINTNNTLVRNSCQAVMNAIAGSPSANGNGPARLVVDYGTYGYQLKRSYGISVYFPCVGEIPSCYPGLEFCQRTHWDKFLNAFLSSPKGSVARGERPIEVDVKPATVKEPAPAPELQPAYAGVGGSISVQKVAGAVSGSSNAPNAATAGSPNGIAPADGNNNGGGIKTTHGDTIKTTYGDVIKTTHGDPIKTPNLPTWILPTMPKFGVRTPVGHHREPKPDVTHECGCGRKL